MNCRSTSLSALLLLLVALSVASCGDEGTTGTDGFAEEESVARLAVSAVTPIAAQFYLSRYLDILTGASRPNDDVCFPLLEACSSGEVRYCRQSTGARITFTECDAAGLVTDGVIAITGTLNSGAAAFNITLGDTRVIGSIGYAYQPQQGCLSEFFSNLNATSALGAVIASGSLEYCELAPESGPIAPTSGAISALVTREGGQQNGVNVDVVQGGAPGAVTVTVFDATFMTELLHCSANIVTGSISCSAP